MDAFLLHKVNKSLPIEKLLSLLKIQPNRSGFIKCPGHIDKKPSLKIYGRQGRVVEWKCFQCGAGGGSVEFVSLLYRISREQALKKVQDRFYDKRKIDCKPVERGDWWARVFRGWESQFCRKILAFIFQLPVEQRCHVYSGWYNYCIEQLEMASRAGDEVDLDCLSARLEEYLKFIREEYENDLTGTIAAISPASSAPLE